MPPPARQRARSLPCAAGPANSSARRCAWPARAAPPRREASPAFPCAHSRGVTRTRTLPSSSVRRTDAISAPASNCCTRFRMLSHSACAIARVLVVVVVVVVVVVARADDTSCKAFQPPPRYGCHIFELRRPITSPHQHISTSAHHHITTSPHHHITTSPHQHITSHNFCKNRDPTFLK